MTWIPNIQVFGSFHDNTVLLFNTASFIFLLAGVAVAGPLSAVITNMDSDLRTANGNFLIFAFAGHDTTAHTMTWLTLELARKPELQRRVQAEVCVCSLT